MTQRRPRFAVVRAAVAVALFGGIASCASIIGVEDFPDRDPNLGECGNFLYADSACAACVDEGSDAGPNCCGEAHDCRGDALCAKYFDCAARCESEDYACRAKCDARYPDAYLNPAVQAFKTCRIAQCQGTCTTCGSVAEFRGASCAACAEQHCCKETQACLMTKACDESVSCITTCRDPYCYIACGEANHALDPITDLSTCLLTNCASCTVNSDYSCAGRYKLPTLGGGERVTVHIDLIDIIDGLSPIPDAEVRVCSAVAGLGCNGAPPATTNKIGRASLDFEIAAPNGFAGYFLATSPDILDTLIYPPQPLLGGMWLTGTTLPKADAAAVFTFLLGSYDPADGQLYMAAYDCSNFAAAGVSLEVHPASGADPKILYFNGRNQVIKNGTETGTLGAAGAGNVAPGNATIVGKIAATGEPYGTTTVVIQKGAITYANLIPGPAP